MEAEGVEVAEPPVDAVSAFDREWAVTLLERAMGDLSDEFAARQKPEAFAVLRRFLPGAHAPITIEEAAAALGSNANAVKSSVHRLRGRFREILRIAVARTVSAPHEVDEELMYLRTVLLSSPLPRISGLETRKNE
jgi:RNA polymerase sigma-70 factor (ECF subfamily)